PVARDVADKNDATTDPGGAGEFLQKVLASGDYVRFFGYDNVLQQGGEGYLSTYRENFGNPTALAILVNARAMRLHIFDIQGYNPVQLKNYVLYLTALNGEVQNYHDAQILPGGIVSPLLNILNARYIIIPQSVVSGRPRADILTLLAHYPVVFQNDQVRVLENTDAMPRAWIAHDLVYAPASEVASYLTQPGFDPARTILLPDDGRTFTTSPPPSTAAESATITDYDYDQIQLKVTAGSDGMLVLSETYERGWHATIDGQPVPVVEAYGVARAIPITAGEHTVTLTYDPWSLRIGFYISLAAAGVSLIIIAAFLLDRRNRRRNREHSIRVV
ncbi:MAG TPA: YfhO family protein, partial [Thermomicrobiales bacterium]|nr:YfhO family protein [Thermomicrobiales bacterium]